MTNEGLYDMVAQIFKGVNYTSPTWYFGLGHDSIPGGYFTDPDVTNTAARITVGTADPPTTDNFSDAGGRLSMDWSSPASYPGSNIVEKICPPTFNFTTIAVALNTDMAYQISADGVGPSDPPVVLLSQWKMTRNLEDLPIPGDIFEVTVKVAIILQ